MEVLQRTANRGSVSTASYEIDNSLKMEADNSESMTRTPSSAGNRKTWTLSFWFKRTELGAAVRLFEAWDGSTGTSALFTDADLFILDLTAGSNYFTSTAVFRDTSAWNHFVIRVDTTQGTASERARVYVNGSELAGSWNSNIGQNTDLTWNQDVVHYLGVFHNSGNFANGYYAEVINVDGTSLAPTAFGEVDSDSGIWKPIDASPTYGTNGFKLEFKTSGGLGADTSGNGHTWTLNNIAAADQSTDTPTNNFMTLNPLDNNWANVPIINEGATNHHSDSANFEGSSGTIAMSSGKWYWEIKTMHSDGNVYMLGIGSTEYGEVPGSQSPHDVLNFAGLYLANSGTEGGLFVTDSTGGSVYRNAFNPGANYSANDIYGFALDLDSSPQTITFYRNGTNINPSSGAALDIAGACSILPVTVRLSIHEREAQCNFGGYTEFSISSAATDANGYGTFEYAPPSGYYALCTKNLAEYG